MSAPAPVPAAPVSRRALLTAAGAVSGASVLAACSSSATKQATAADLRAAGPLVTPGSAWQARHGLTAAQYQAAFDQWGKAGYRLVHVAGYDTPDGARFVALWEKSPGGAWVARHGMTAADYQTAFTTYGQQGYRLRTVSGYTDRGAERYAAIWEKSGGAAWVGRHGMTAAEYQTAFTTYGRQGYRLRTVSGYTVAGVVRYAAIWDKNPSPAWVARHGETAAQYQQTFNTQTAAGFRLAHVAGYATPGGTRFTSIWEKSGGPAWEARHDLAGTTYQEAVDNWTVWGLRPLTVSGYHDGRRPRFTTVWVGDAPTASSLLSLHSSLDDYLRTNGIGTGQFAIARNGRIVYARSFGAADGTGEPTTNAHRFRIASVTKPITSAAIFSLIEGGKLTLDRKVFGPGGVLGTTYGTKPYNDNLKAITIEHLLTHTVGFWTNDGDDPMFYDRKLTHRELITKVLDERPPTAPPGNFAYSNFGYCLLGRVIETITGQSYAAYTGGILARAGVTRAEIAGNTLADRKPFEVTYAGRDGQDPYGMNVTRMDSHGGWIATAIDVVKFALRVDGKGSPADILSAATLTSMETAPAGSPGYAHGWGINGTERSHNGALPGTSSDLVRTGTGTVWAAAINTRDKDNTTVTALDQAIRTAVGKVTTWPSGALPNT